MVTCSAAAASVRHGGVGTGKTVTATGLTLTGAAAGNYTLAATTATTTADITAVALTASVTAANKVYDGTTTRDVSELHADAACVSGDDGDVQRGQRDVRHGAGRHGQDGDGDGHDADGAAAANYTLAATTATTTADITAVSADGDRDGGEQGLRRHDDARR